MAIAAVSALSLILFWPTSNEVQPKTFAEKIKAAPTAVVIDMRTADEFSSGHIPGAMHIDWLWPSRERRIAELDTAASVFLYSRYGEYNSKAESYLLSKGFTSVTTLQGGIVKWRTEKFPLTPVEITPPRELELTFNDFSRLLDLEHAVIVDFYIPWDTNCRKTEPIIDAIALEHRKTVKILRINIDKYKHLATEMGIENIPLLQFYENGNLTGEFEGVASRRMIEQQLFLDDYIPTTDPTLSVSVPVNKR